MTLDQLELMETKVFPESRLDEYLKMKIGKLEKLGGKKTGGRAVSQLNRTFISNTIFEGIEGEASEEYEEAAP